MTVVSAAVAMAVEKISTSALEGSSPEEVMCSLHSEFVQVGPVDDSLAVLYTAALQKAAQEKGRVRVGEGGEGRVSVRGRESECEGKGE